VSALKLAFSLAIGELALASLAVASQSASAPSPAEIIKRSVAVNTADWQALPQYSFCAQYTKCKVDDSGHASTEQSKRYESLMIEGSPYERVIGINNQPLSSGQQQQEQAKLNREIARRQSESAAERKARVSKYQNQRAEEHMLMQQMVEAFQFTLAGEQEVNGVECYVLDAKPNPAYQPPVQKARVLLGMQGRLWIDKQHYHWVKVQAEVINPVEFGLFVAKVKPGTKFELEQAPAGDVWLPKRFSQSVNASVFGVYGMRCREEEEYSDYRPSALSANGQPVASGAASGAAAASRPPTHPSVSEVAVR
jgi:hypothetical protein